MAVDSKFIEMVYHGSIGSRFFQPWFGFIVAQFVRFG